MEGWCLYRAACQHVPSTSRKADKVGRSVGVGRKWMCAVNEAIREDGNNSEYSIKVGLIPNSQPGGITICKPSFLI